MENKSVDEGSYRVQLQIKGNRANAHFLAKTIEEQCSLAEKYLDLKIKKKVILEK